MKKTFKSVVVLSVAALGLGLSACDSPAENKAEDQAQAVRKSADATGEALEEKGEAVKEAGEAQADRMEDQADKMDKTPG